MKISKKSKSINNACNDTAECSLEEAILAEDKLPDLNSSNISALFNSTEFKTPISDAEAERYLSASVKESDIKDVHDVEETTLTECIKGYLTENYPTVADFKTTRCRSTNKQLFIEGKITFTNGKTKRTLFEFTSAGKNLLKGTNKGIAENITFTLAYSLETNKLLAECLKYSYVQSGRLVEGISKVKGVIL
jgi:hypothetical protein